MMDSINCGRGASLCVIESLGVLGLAACISGAALTHPYRYSVVDIPISVATGTVRTPSFPVSDEDFVIMIQVEKRLPFKRLECMMGMTQNPFDWQEHCTADDPILRADWTVWDQARIVSSGASTTRADAMYTNEHLFKMIGRFMGEVSKQYVVEVRFTRDGTPLNAANPHLIVIAAKLH